MIKEDSHMHSDLYTRLKKTSLDDYISILNIASKIEKIENNRESDIKFAILGSTSIQMIVMVLKALLACNDIHADIYEGEYNGLLSDTYDISSKFYAFAPEIILLIPDHRDIPKWPVYLESTEDVLDKAHNVADYFMDILYLIHEHLPNAHILFSNIIGPDSFPLGNLEANYIFSRESYCSIINLELIKKRPPYVTILDTNRLASDIGKIEWFDDSAYFLSKQGFSLKYIGYFCAMVTRQVIALKGMGKKCLVFDLDNTIWGGAVGDVGYEGILLDPNDPEGEAYIAFQEYILMLKQRGVILAVCSKNDEKNAKEPFIKNRFMCLRLDDISCFVANWDDKVSNIRKIADHLNIGIDSMVFFDDNATERELVRKFIPEVEVIEVPEDPALYRRTLDTANAFDQITLTKEDIDRFKTYRDERMRKDFSLGFDDYNEYLQGLEMRASFSYVNDKSLGRFCQLLNKSNQFNLMTHRYSEAQAGSMLDDTEYGLYTVSMRDRFSDYGIIACIILYFEKDTCYITDWCMSCRVLKKGVEYYTLKKIIEVADKRGSKHIIGRYTPTKKNDMVRTLYLDFGFNVSFSTQEGFCEYILDYDDYSHVFTENHIEEDAYFEER